MNNGMVSGIVISIMLVLTLLLAGCARPLTETPEPTHTPTPAKVIVSDDQIEITIANMERVSSIPPELPKQFHAIGNLKSGHDYAIIFLAFANVGTGVIGPNMKSKPMLIDNVGQEWQSVAYSFSKLSFRDPTDINSDLFFSEESTYTLLFELPVPNEPKTIKFAYFFWESLEDTSSDTREIDITLMP